MGEKNGDTGNFVGSDRRGRPGEMAVEGAFCLGAGEVIKGRKFFHC